MKKKLTALLLALTMALTLLTGCSGSTASTQTDPVLASLDAGAVDDVVDYLTDGTLKSSDTALTVDGEEVPAPFYLYWVAYQMSSLAQSGVSADQLDTEISEGQTAADFLKENSQTYATYYYSMAKAAKEAGLTLDEDEQSQVDTYVEGLDAAAMLYYSTNEDAQRIVYEQYLLGQKLQDSLYGEDGKNAPSEDDLTAYAAEQNYYTCRYILFPLTDGEGNEVDSDAQKEQCQKVYDELKAVDAAELEDTFQTYQEQYNTQKGADGNTDRFTSSTSSVVSGFADTVIALGNNELGMTEEATSYGYFVILRLPLELDESTMTTLRSSYVSARFDSDIQDKAAQAEVAWADAADELDIKAFCTKLAALQQDITEAQTAAQEADSSAAVAE